MDIDNLKSFAEMQAELDETDKSKVEDTTEETVETNEENTAENDSTTESEDGDETISDEVDDESEQKPIKPKDETPWGKKGKVPKGILDRFRKLNERDRQKDARIHELEGVMKQFIEASGMNKPTREPTLQDFLEAGKSENDFINYLVEQRLTQRSQIDNQRRQQEEALKRTQDEINDRWNSAFQKAKTDLPDYDEVVANADVNIPTTSMRYIAESDIGPYISYTIASDHGLQDKIDSVNSPAEKHAVIMEVEKTIRAWLSSRTKKVSNSAGVQPQKSVGNGKPKVPGSIKNGKSSKALDPATATIEEWLGID